MMSLNEKNARKTIDILQLEGCDINTALTLAGFNIRTDFPRLTDKECQDIAINYPYSYKIIRGWFNRPLPTYITIKERYMDQEEILRIIKEYFISCGGEYDDNASKKRQDFISEIRDFVCLECGNMNSTCYCNEAYDE